MIDLINKILALIGHKIVKTEEQIDYKTEPLILGEWCQYDWERGIYDSGYGANSYIFDSIRDTVPHGIVEIGKPRYNCTEIKINFDGFGSHEIQHSWKIKPKENSDTGREASATRYADEQHLAGTGSGSGGAGQTDGPATIGRIKENVKKRRTPKDGFR